MTKLSIISFMVVIEYKCILVLNIFSFRC